MKRSCCSPIVWENRKLEAKFNRKYGLFSGNKTVFPESRTKHSENHLQKPELDAKHKTDKMCSGEFQNCYEPVTAHVLILRISLLLSTECLRLLFPCHCMLVVYRG